MLHVDINKSHVNHIVLIVDIIYVACFWQTYAIIITCNRSKSRILNKNERQNSLVCLIADNTTRSKERCVLKIVEYDTFCKCLNPTVTISIKIQLCCPQGAILSIRKISSNVQYEQSLIN